MADRVKLRIQQVMDQTGVSRRTVYNWINGGKVEYVRTPGGSIRIFADTVWKDGKQPSVS